MSNDANEPTSSNPSVASLWETAKKDRGSKGLSRAFRSRKAGEQEPSLESEETPKRHFAPRRGNFDRPASADRDDKQNVQGYSSDGTAMFPKTSPKEVDAAPVRGGVAARPSPIGLPIDVAAPAQDAPTGERPAPPEVKRVSSSSAPRLQDRVIDVTDFVGTAQTPQQGPAHVPSPAAATEPSQESAPPRRIPEHTSDVSVSTAETAYPTQQDVDGSAVDVATIIAASDQPADTGSVNIPSTPADVIDLRTEPPRVERAPQRTTMPPVPAPLTAGPVATAGESVVTLQSVKAGYGKTKVLSDITLEAKTGEILAVIGPSRSGKSTVLRVLGGLVRPTGGKVYIDGARVQGPLHDALDEAGVAFVTAATAHMPDMTVREYLQLTPVEGAQSHDIADVIFASFPHLAVHSGRALGDLKSVDFTILALAQVMVTRPRIIVIDDIGGTLDVGSLAVLRSVCRDVADTGVGIVLSHADPFHALSLADHAVILDRGRTTHQGPATQIKDLLSPVHP